MHVRRRLALAGAVIAVQFSILASAQASSLQAAELNSPAAFRQVGFFLVEPHRLAPAAPLIVSAVTPMSYGRMTSGTDLASPDAASALTAYYAARSRLNERVRPQTLVPSDQTASTWRADANRWQFDETSRDWRFHSGHWHGFEDGHHERDDDGHEHPPAVPIPAGFWLFGSGLALLAMVIRAQRGHSMAGGR
jgi:hypothetical protein